MMAKTPQSTPSYVSALLARRSAAQKIVWGIELGNRIKGSLGQVRGEGKPAGTPASSALELSVVIPCLNEADTIRACVEQVADTLSANGIAGEILVADNGSEDASCEIAEAAGARVVHVSERGYGNALRGGINAAHGRYVIMGDADGSYDFGEIPRFLEKLREGFELVQGCRLESGGGRVLPGAMPPLHRWIGNPVLSFLTRLWFRTEVQDAHCGLRGFDRDLPDRLGLRCSGMEFATEMIVKASFADARIAQVPITLHPDGRIQHEPHLRTFRDGWRHLRFMLLYTPDWLFLIPGSVLLVLGLIAFGIALPGVRIAGVLFDVHTLLFGSLGVILGYQAIWFSTLAKAVGVAQHLVPTPESSSRMNRFTLERGIQLGVGLGVVGIGLLLVALLQWKAVEFGDLDVQRTMRWVIPGATLATVGSQTILGSFFLSVLDLTDR